MTFANKGHKHSEQHLQWLSKACWLYSSIHDTPVTSLGLEIKDSELICSTQSEGKEITEQNSMAWETAQWLSEYLERIYLSESSINCLILFCSREKMVWIFFLFFTPHGPSRHQAWWYYLQGLVNTTRQPKIKSAWKEGIFLYYFQIWFQLILPFKG